MLERSATATEQLSHHSTPAGQVSGFAATFWWVLAITIAAAIPTIVLARTEYQARRRANALRS